MEYSCTKVATPSLLPTLWKDSENVMLLLDPYTYVVRSVPTGFKEHVLRVIE